MSNDRIFEAKLAWCVNAHYTLEAAIEANRRARAANRAHRSPETKAAYAATLAAHRAARSNKIQARQNHYRLVVEARDGV